MYANFFVKYRIYLVCNKEYHKIEKQEEEKIEKFGEIMSKVSKGIVRGREWRKKRKSMSWIDMGKEESKERLHVKGKKEGKMEKEIMQ